MKKVIIIFSVIGLSGLVGYKLFANKQEMQQNAKLSEITSDKIPVRVIHPENKSLDRQIQSDGTLEAITDLVVISETQGKILSVYKEKGDRVRKGDLLAQVENDLITAEVEAAKANLDKLTLDLNRFSKLYESDATTKRQIEEIQIGLKNAEAQYKSAKKRLDNTSIRATANGIINDDYVQEGAYISPGTKLYEIVDVSQLKLNVKLTVTEVLTLKEGDLAEITISAFPATRFSGKVTSIAAKADNALKYNVELSLTNQKEFTLKSGMYAKAQFDWKDTTERTLLNRNAIVGSLQKPQVFIIDNNVAKLKDIQVGETTGDQVEVLSGVRSSDNVVLTGHINLKDGTKVEILN